MASNILTPEARRENAAALASALGLGLEDAAKALALEIKITVRSHDAAGHRIQDEIVALLSRTVQQVSKEKPLGDVAAELVIGAAEPATTAPRLYLSTYCDRAVIGQSADQRSKCAPIPAILGLLTACYASGAILNLALGQVLPFGVPDPLMVRFDELGVDLESLGKPVELGHTYMAGAGAIGNGFLYAARHLDLGGQLEIVDDDCVSSGNLNRQIWFTTADLDLPKASQLALRAKPFFPRLDFQPRQYRLQDLSEKAGPWLSRLIVAVDSRRARRELQNEFPGEVFDASTTDIREIVLHYHRQPTATACLSCIYEPDTEELSREQHIADHLGVSLVDVRTERISRLASQAIAARFPGLLAENLVGIAYDTLFKRLCAESQLHTLAGRTVVAPFAFVSVLAGTLLAIEIVRRLGCGPADTNFNYWRVSPWHPLYGRRRVMRPRQPGCAFCGNPVLRKVNDDLWRTE